MPHDMTCHPKIGWVDDPYPKRGAVGFGVLWIAGAIVTPLTRYNERKLGETIQTERVPKEGVRGSHAGPRFGEVGGGATTTTQ